MNSNFPEKKKKKSLKVKPWINKNTQPLMTEYDRLFKRYCNENNLTLKVARYRKYKIAKTLLY